MHFPADLNENGWYNIKKGIVPRVFGVCENTNPMKGLDNVPGLEMHPYGFKIFDIYFQTDYEHLDKSDLTVFFNHFKYIKERVEESDYLPEQKALLKELMSRNETTFRNRYLRKSRFEDIPLVPIADFDFRNMYCQVRTTSKLLQRMLEKELKHIVITEKITGLMHQASNSITNDTAPMLGEYLAQRVIGDLFPNIRRKINSGIETEFMPGLMKEVDKIINRSIDSLVSEYLTEKSPSTLQLIEGAKFFYGLLQGEMSFAISPFSDRTIFHNIKRAHRLVAETEQKETIDKTLLEQKEKENHFAKNNETKTPVELLRINENCTVQWNTPADQLAYDEHPYLVRVVPNLWPGIVPSCFSIIEELDNEENQKYHKYIELEEGVKHLAGLEQKTGGSKVTDFFKKTFHQYVVIDHPKMFIDDPKTMDDYNHIGAMSWEHCTHILKAIKEARKYNYEQDPAVKYVVIFKNWKGEAGASVPKSHHQILATPNVPTEIHKRVQAAKVYGDIFFEEMLDFYESCDLRIAKKGRAVAYSCPWPDFPGTIEIYIRGEKVNHLEDLSKQDAKDFYGLLHIILSSIGGKGAYNYFLCDTPPGEKEGKIPVSISLNTRDKNNKAGAELAGSPLSAYPPDIYARRIAEQIKDNEKKYSEINGKKHYKNLETYL